ncbi:hypothetical protein DFH07DRAFT_456883 [Mycena maculata]|uniref:Ubiquitin-like protease family profile domain-containing protein n=1 Tax=Mycena maculata TaxID=230809 RepID=A0AAD7NFW5_9AGAR|nr:hypothetical protein DFH07DRAFT_456883 [Mycena maculata]
MLISTEDRLSVSTLHGHPPANMRDASQGSQGWTKAPTKISMPTNPPRGLGATNPFNRNRTQDTLHQPRGGNPVSQNTLTNWSSPSMFTNGRNGPPPAKKARTDDPGVRSRKKVPLPKPNLDLPRRKPGASSRSSVGSSHHSRLVPDGEATRDLRNRPLLAPEDSDPIEPFPEESRPPGFVKGTVQSIDEDKRFPDPSPRVDFYQHIQGGKIKNGMKPRNPSSSVVVTSSALPNGVHANTTNRAPNKTKFLPIKAWYLGRKLFDGQESYHLIWESTGPTKGRMTIRSGDAPGPPSRHSEEVDLPSVAKAVWFGDPTEDYPNKVFVVETYEKTRRNKPLGIQYPEFFKQGGKHGEGDIMIKFDTSSLAWSRPTYKEFVDWLKSHVKDRQTLRGKAGNHKWDMANRISQLTESSVKREQQQETGSSGTRVILKAKPKEPPVPGLPFLDDWSPPTSVAIANTAQPTRSRRQGSSNTPIEIESPTRPPPRTIYNQSTNSGGGPDPVRRSARQSVAPQRPYVDPDEVILVYPPNQTGAVNITNGDVNRLSPGEFLNDTLIEFGLKLWLQDLEKENPELVKQIHVFSSFFYKKLNKKNPQEGYESVKKWTSKFDLFDKKYIIVPINENLHWYLAIIYHPEHTLNPPPPTISKSPATRRKARQEADRPEELDQATEHVRRLPDSKASSVTRRSLTPSETPDDTGTLSPISNAQAEAEVANELMSSCSITEDDVPPSAIAEKTEGTGSDDEHDSLFDEMDVDADLDTTREQPPLPPPAVDSGDPLNDGDSHTASEGPAVSEPDIMDVDASADPDQSMDPLDVIDSPPPVSRAVEPVRFYGKSAKSRGKRKAESSPLETFPVQDAPPPESYEDDADDAMVVGGQPTTYVFTLDSLGSRHPKVVKVLAQYLKYEAQEKRKIPLEMTSQPIGKAALVPHQPNFCDCGIYLLHLAQTFISDPERYCELITTKRGNTNSLERQAQWNNDGTKILRETLSQRIAELSIEWKKNRAAKEELKKKEELEKKDEEVPESSDDDVDIVETTPAKPVLPKTPKTGKAMRMRG